MVSFISSSKELHFSQINKHSSKFFNIFLMPIQISFFNSPIGILEIKASNEFIHSLQFNSTLKNPGTAVNREIEEQHNHPIMVECERQLTAYFEGERKAFDFPFQQEGSAFQQQVWAELLHIPFGRTISYMELSKRIKNVKAIRAVGTANGSNAISIVVPCHRVIGSNGDLTGYSGDLWRKKWLLDHEGKFANGIQTLF